MVKSTKYEAPHYAVLSCLLLFLHFRPKCSQDRFLRYLQSVYSTLRVRDQVLHPFKTTAKIIIFYILIVMFIRDWRREDNSKLNGSERSPNSVSELCVFLVTCNAGHASLCISCSICHYTQIRIVDAWISPATGVNLCSVRSCKGNATVKNSTFVPVLGPARWNTTQHISIC
jgi:hypothetical protein